MPRLHVNVDHVATVRQARRGARPDPVEWAVAAERAGAQGITCHLREDRRHVLDADLPRLRAAVTTLLNLECSLAPEMVAIALASGADEACLVPENRAEITTEGGLDVVRERRRLVEVVPRFRERGILVSLFVDADERQLEAAAEVGADFVELHTGAYAGAADGSARAAELARLVRGAERAHALGLRVNAGHGLDLENVGPVAALPHVEELNIGHALVARALFVGVAAAIGEMLARIRAGAASTGSRAGGAHGSGTRATGAGSAEDAVDRRAAGARSRRPRGPGASASSAATEAPAAGRAAGARRPRGPSGPARGDALRTP